MCDGDLASASNNGSDEKSADMAAAIPIATAVLEKAIEARGKKEHAVFVASGEECVSSVDIVGRTIEIFKKGMANPVKIPRPPTPPG